MAIFLKLMKNNFDKFPVILYQVFQKKEAETELERCTMAEHVIKEEVDPLQPTHDIGIVIEGVQVLSRLGSPVHSAGYLSSPPAQGSGEEQSISFCF